MSSLQAVTVVTISSALLVGMQMALLGSIKLALARRLSIGEKGISGLLLVLNLALIPMMLLCGLLLDLGGVRLVLLLGSLISCLSLLSISLSPTYRRALVAIFLAGLGGAALCIAAVVLMPHSFFAPEQDMTAALLLGHVFIALGALLTPATVDLLLRFVDFRRMMALMCLLCLVPAVLCVLPTFGRPLTNLQPQARPLLDHPHLWHIWIAGLVFFFYAPLEAAVGIWTTTYLTDLGSSERGASWVLSGFWTSFMASRLLFAWLRPTPAWDLWVLVLFSLAAAATLGNLVGIVYRTSARAGILLLGFVLGPILPTLIAVVFRDFSQERGTAYALIFAIGSAGSLLLAPLFGLQARRISVQNALRLPMMLAVLLTLASMAFAFLVGAG